MPLENPNDLKPPFEIGIFELDECGRDYVIKIEIEGKTYFVGIDSFFETAFQYCYPESYQRLAHKLRFIADRILEFYSQ